MSLESPDNTLNVRNAVLKVSRVEMNTLSANTVTSDLTVSGNTTVDIRSHRLWERPGWHRQSLCGYSEL